MLTLLGIVAFTLVILCSGIPIAFSFMIVTSLGVLGLQGGDVAFVQQVTSIVSSLNSFTLVPIPFFVLMGTVLWHSNIGSRAVSAIEKLLGRIPGRLPLLTMLSGSVFSALSGSTIANTALLSKMLLPELRARNYPDDLSVGPIMASGGLAMLIPPSALAVVLATIAKVSVAKILIAAVIPGLLLAICYIVYILARAIRVDAHAQAKPEPETVQHSWTAALTATAKHLLPLGLIIGAVTGSMIAGLATPTEAAALGAMSSILLALIYRQLSWKAFKAALMEALRITVMILAIVATATGFSQILAFSGGTSAVASLVSGMDVHPLVLVLIMQFIVFVLGCFMDQIAIMLITIPIFLPLILLLGLDPIWFGVLMLVNLETALMTPPLGLLLIIMQSTAKMEFLRLCRAAAPFVLINMAVLVAMILFPEIVTTPLKFITP